MILPGKLTIGFLQEDNPQKFFFRVSPLIIKEENGYQVVEDARQWVALVVADLHVAVASADSKTL